MQRETSGGTKKHQPIIRKRKTLQKVRQEMEQKIQQMLAQLENVLAQLDISENERQRIRTSADEVRTEVLNGIEKN